MDKILALQNEEQQDEIRFKETVKHRDLILKRRTQIETLEKKIGQLQREIKVEEPKMFEMETEIELLQTEIDSITNDIRRKMAGVLRNEEKLKSAKESFKKLLRAAIEKNKEIHSTYQPTNNLNPKPINSETNEAEIRVWVLKGKIEANKIILEYQKRKIEEMAEIARRIGTPFIEHQETESPNYK
ncbi:uncharacterized protein LOC126750482 [Anthonomus grandis grandis]|uniref:uncharacterized protein LOC126750482 n=1 Tax=Anthonomus grandis grandis TaxID=2921223 RepID=UPI0021653D5B|nr:uncharacterized protein LOC126750482 [Anthonomus grandis grandis]